LTQEINDKETEDSIVIEDVVDTPEAPETTSDPSPVPEDPKLKAEMERTRMLMEGLYCFSSLQQYIQNNPEVIQKIEPKGSHHSHSGKLVSALFGHCQRQHGSLNVTEQMRKVQEDSGNTKKIQELFMDVDVDAIFENQDSSMNMEEKKMLYQFNEIAKEMQKRQKKPKSPEVNVAGVKVSEMNTFMILLPVGVLVGVVLFAWKNLFGEEEKKPKKKKKDKKGK
jgi:hypothetical protein